MANILPDYVHRLLVDIAKTEGFENYQIETGAGSSHGNGMHGIMISVKITGNRQCNEQMSTESLHLMCKVAPDNAIRRQEFQTEMLFIREVYVYKHLLPLLSDFQRQKGLPDDESFHAYPKCYAAVADAAKGEFVLIMEDLRAKQYCLWPKQEPIATDHVYLVIKRLAKLHAISFALRDQQPETFDSLRCLSDVTCPFFENTNFDKLMYASYERAKSVLKNPEHVQIMDEVKNQFHKILHDCLDEGVSEPFVVVGHGDFHINNIMFRYRVNEDDVRKCSPHGQSLYSIFIHLYIQLLFPISDE